jgi:hypothetical protein
VVRLGYPSNREKGRGREMEGSERDGERVSDAGERDACSTLGD